MLPSTAPKPKQFNTLLTIMGSGLSVKEKEGCYIFKDGNNKYFYNQFDMIYAEGDVVLACKFLIELTPEMVQYLVGVEIELDKQVMNKMTKCINNYIDNLYGECDKTNSINRSMKTRINMLVETLYERQRSDLVDLVYHLPRYDYLMIFLQWWDDIIKLTAKKKYWFELDTHTSAFILPRSHRLYDMGSTVRNLDDNDWRKKIVSSRLNWNKYDEAQLVKSKARQQKQEEEKKGKKNEAAGAASKKCAGEGTYQDGEENEIYDTNAFG